MRDDSYYLGRITSYLGEIVVELKLIRKAMESEKDELPPTYDFFSDMWEQKRNEVKDGKTSS